MTRHPKHISLIAAALGCWLGLNACTADSTASGESEPPTLAQGLELLRRGHASYGFAYKHEAPAGPALSVAIDTSGLTDPCRLYSSQPPQDLEHYWLLRVEVGAALAGEYDATRSAFEADGGELVVFDRGRHSRSQQARAARGTITLDEDVTEPGAPLSMHLDVELLPENTREASAEEAVSYMLDLTARYCPSLCSYGVSENADRCEPD